MRFLGDVPKTSAGSTTISVPIRQVQQGLAAYFGPEAMAHSCGTGVCDGRWGPGTERVLDRAFDRFHPTGIYDVVGSSVHLPTGMAQWVQEQAAQWTPVVSTPAQQSGAEALDNTPLPYSSPRRRSTSNLWLGLGAAGAALGLGTLGYVAWKKRGR